MYIQCSPRNSNPHITNFLLFPGPHRQSMKKIQRESSINSKRKAKNIKGITVYDRVRASTRLRFFEAIAIATFVVCKLYKKARALYSV